MIKFLLMVLSFGIASSAAAQDGYSEAITADLPTFEDNRDALMNPPFELGYMFMAMKYKEPKMHDKGTLSGISAAYNWYNRTETWRIRAEGDLSQGSYTYYGQTWGGTPLTTRGYENLFNARLLSGKSIPISSSFLLTTYAGLGRRFLETNDSGDGGYKREITYTYLPIGIDAALLPGHSQDFRLRANLELDLLLSGKAKAYMQKFGSEYVDPIARQNRGYGVRASVASDFKIGKKMMASVQPYVHFWRIEKSRWAQLYKDESNPMGVIEPTNETISTGATASVLF